MARHASVLILYGSLVLVVAPGRARAQGAHATETGQAAETGDSAAERACFPECRTGFVCAEGRCVSICNPPCAEAERCTAEAECEPRPVPPAYQAAGGVAQPVQVAPEQVAPQPSGPPPDWSRARKSRLRDHMLIAGWLSLGLSYGVSAMAAVGADFKNESGYLLIPVAGPIITLMRRDYVLDDDVLRSDEDERALDVLAVEMLVFDAMVQIGAAVLIGIGYAQDDGTEPAPTTGVSVYPTRVGAGHGLGLSGFF